MDKMNRQVFKGDEKIPKLPNNKSDKKFKDEAIEYVETNLLTDYAEYKTNLKSIVAQIGFKIKGYSKKDKFQLILDSKTPNTSTSVI